MGKEYVLLLWKGKLGNVFMTQHRLKCSITVLAAGEMFGRGRVPSMGSSGNLSDLVDLGLALNTTGVFLFCISGSKEEGMTVGLFLLLGNPLENFLSVPSVLGPVLKIEGEII